MDQYKLNLKPQQQLYTVCSINWFYDFFMLNNTEIYFISWIEILETETIYRMEFFNLKYAELFIQRKYSS